MTPKEILQGNKLIAEFMGLEIIDRPYGNGFVTLSETEICDVDDLSYHTDWNWLMPVVEKICHTNVNLGGDYVDYAYPRTFGMLNQSTGQLMIRLNGHQVFESSSLLETTYTAVADFIHWYNEIKIN